MPRLPRLPDPISAARAFLQGAAPFVDPRQAISDAWWVANNPLDRLMGRGRAANGQMMFPMGGRFRPDPRRIRQLKQIPEAAREWDLSMQRQLDDAFEGERDFVLRGDYGDEAVTEQFLLAQRRLAAEEDMNALLQEHSPYKPLDKIIDRDMAMKRAITKRPGLMQFDVHKSGVQKKNYWVSYGRRRDEETSKVGVENVGNKEFAKKLFTTGTAPYSIPKKLRYKPDAPLKFDPRRRSGR